MLEFLLLSVVTWGLITNIFWQLYYLQVFVNVTQSESIQNVLETWYLCISSSTKSILQTAGRLVMLSTFADVDLTGAIMTNHLSSI